jgi:hypothetical protein
VLQSTGRILDSSYEGRVWVACHSSLESSLTTSDSEPESELITKLAGDDMMFDRRGLDRGEEGWLPAKVLGRRVIQSLYRREEIEVADDCLERS